MAPGQHNARAAAVPRPGRHDQPTAWRSTIRTVSTTLPIRKGFSM
jgi:hypothetical protein